MKKTICRALAIVIASSLAYAGSESEEWLSLDKELAKLNSSLVPQGGGAMEINGFIRSSYVNGQDLAAEDTGGFSIDNARLIVHGSVGDYGYYVSLEGSNAPQFYDVAAGPGLIEVEDITGMGDQVGVLDAFGSWNINDQIALRMGQFRPQVLHSSQLDPSNLLFIDRTVQGLTFAGRDIGVEISGTFDQLSWWIGAQNGQDNMTDELAYYARAEFEAMGEGWGDVQGAFGAPEDNCLTIGAAFYSDQTMDDEDWDIISVDAGWTGSGFSASGEFVNYAEDIFDGGSDSSQWNATLAYLFAPEWEGAVRYEDLTEDNILGQEAQLITVGINRYVSGHDVKWSLNWTDINYSASASSDDVGDDTAVIQLGLTVGW